MTTQNNQTPKVRETYLDIARGAAICLVVLGHVIANIYDTETYNTNLIFRICYSMHLALFFYISGYLARGTKSADPELYGNKWFLRRTAGILIPYVIWTVFKCFTHEGNIITALFVDPYFWFLINLWIYHAIAWLGHKFKRSVLIEAGCYAVIFALYVIFTKYSIDSPLFGNAAMFCPHYILGRLVAGKKIPEKAVRYFERASIVLYPLAMIFYTYEEYGKWMPFLKGLIPAMPESVFIYGMKFYNYYITAPLGVAFFMLLFRGLDALLKKKEKVLSYIGTVTLPIYVLHSYFFIHVEKNIPLAVLSFVLGVAVPILIYEISSLLPQAAKILFGSSGKLLREKLFRPKEQHS